MMMEEKKCYYLKRKKCSLQKWALNRKGSLELIHFFEDMYDYKLKSENK